MIILDTNVLSELMKSQPIFATIAAARRRIGRPISQIDAQIAAIARSHDTVLATRNIRDFEECGIEIINPWQ